MAQFDVCRNPDPTSHVYAPYLLDVQIDFLDQFETRVVVPLMAEGALKPATRLNPVFDVEDRKVVMATQSLAAIRQRDIGEFVISLSTNRPEIIDAIDFLITGI